MRAWRGGVWREQSSGCGYAVLGRPFGGGRGARALPAVAPFFLERWGGGGCVGECGAPRGAGWRVGGVGGGPCMKAKRTFCSNSVSLLWERGGGWGEGIGGGPGRGLSREGYIEQGRAENDDRDG